MKSLSIAIALSLSASAPLSAAPTTFDTTVKPLFTQTCAACHNEKLSSGGLNVSTFLDPHSIETKRDAWEAILAKLRTGEMPPKGIPKPPPEQMDALLSYVQSEFDRLDNNTKPDPGRIVAHRGVREDGR